VDTSRLGANPIITVRQAKEKQGAGSGGAAALKSAIAKLRAELQRTSEELDILKKGRRVLCQGIGVEYAFLAEHHGQFRLNSMCRVLGVPRNGYYTWKAAPNSLRAQPDETLTTAIQQSFEDSEGVYDSPRLPRYLREAGMRCGKKRVSQLMRAAKLR
jgi:putative transposase